MADDNDIIYDVDIDLTDSVKALQRLKTELQGVGTDLVGSVGMVQQQMRKAAAEYAAYIKRLEGDLKRLKKEGGDTSKHEVALANIRARQQSAGDAVRSRVAGGVRIGDSADETLKTNRAVVEGQIARMRSDNQVLMNRVTKEVLGSALDSIRLTREQVEARIREEGLKAARLRDRTSDPMMRAREADASFRDTEFLRDVSMQATTGRRNDNRRTIQQIGDSAEQYQANIAEATFRSTQKLLNNSEEEFKARSDRAALRRYRNATFDPRDERVLADRAAEDRSYRAENGDAAAGMRKTRERMDLNGGADFLAMQTSLLSNYMLIGGGMGAGAFLGNFIVQLDAEFKQFQAITATTNTEMELMEERILSVAEKTKFSAVEVAQAATTMGQAGLSAGQVSVAIESVAMLATAAGTDLKSAVDVVTSTLNIFNLQTSEGAHIADVYTAALNESKLTLDQLTLSLQYAGNTAATAGVGYNELTASIGAMANAGIRSGSTMGTGIRQLLVDLMNPSEKVRAELENVGLTMNDINVEANGLTGVIMNLQEAGFGTANAFAAFEVRAAAAFTALASNVDTITTLRQSFLLSTAAAAANEIQMSSLSASWSRFADNAGTVAYLGLEPTKDFLQDLLTVLADLLGTLSENGDGLKVLGTLVASLGLAWAAVKIGSLVVGFTQLAVAARASSSAVSILFSLLGANPIGRAIMLATAGAIAMSQLGDSAANAADQIDKIDARINDMSGQVSEGQNRIQSLADTIDDLTKKREALEKVGNEGLRATRIMEVVSTFSELAGEVDTSTASVGDLITALQNLKGELAADMPNQFGMMIADLELKIDELRRTAEQYQGTANFNARGFVNEVYGATMSRDQAQSINRGDFDYASMAPQIASDFGEDVGKAFVALVNNEELDGLVAKGLRDNLSTVMLRSQRELNGLTQISDPSDEQSARIEELELNLEALGQLKESFDVFSTTLLNLSAAEKQVELNRQKRGVSLVAQQTEGPGGIDAEVTSLGEFVRNGLRDITNDQGADGKGLGVREVAERLKALDAAFEERLAKINRAADEVAKELAESGEMTEERAQALLANAPFRSKIAELRTPLRSQGKSVAENIREIDAYNATKQQATLRRQIDDAMQSLAKATSDQEVDVVKAYIKRLQGELQKVSEQVFDLTTVEETENSAADQAIDRDQMQTLLDEGVAEADRTILERRAALYKEEAEGRERALETELTNVTAKMKLLLDDMENASSVDMLEAIRKKLMEYGQQAKILAGQIAGMDVGADFIPSTGAVGTQAAHMSGGTAPTATGGNVRDQVWNFFAKKGLPSHQIAGIMGNVAQESAFNPLANGDAGEAFGLFQHNDRKGKLFDYIGGKQNLGDVQKQLEFAWHELQTTEGEALRRLTNAGNVQEATEAFLQFERPSGYNTGVQNSHGYGSRVGAAEEAFRRYGKGSAASGEEQRTAAVGARQTELLADTDKTLQDAAQREAKARSRAIAKSLSAEADAVMAEINTLMTQSSKVSNPEALNSILDQVKGKWATVIDKEVAAFAEQNAGSDTLKEDLDAFRKSLDAKLNQDVVQLLDKYQAVIESQVPEGLKVARAQLDAAQAPGNEGRFSPLEVQELQNNVTLQERAALTEKLNALEQFRTLITTELAAAEAQYGTNSEQANALRARQTEVERSVGDIRITTTAQTEAATRAETSLVTAMQSANAAWMQRNGIMRADGSMVSEAEQFGQAWGQVLDGLTSGFATLFTNLASGQMEAGEAFKQFGMSVVAMFTEMIAKALAFQVVQGLMGGVGGGGGGIGGFFSSLFTAPGMATGGWIPGAANGELITGAAGFRDSEYRKVQPGEMILRTSAVNAIGRDAMTKMNALGNRSLSEGTPTLDAGKTSSDPSVTNVWVVLPEEQAQMGPSDIVAIISDDMRNRGMTRQLVKSIASGR